MSCGAAARSIRLHEVATYGTARGTLRPATSQNPQDSHRCEGPIRNSSECFNFIQGWVEKKDSGPGHVSSAHAKPLRNRYKRFVIDGEACPQNVASTAAPLAIT